MPLQPPPPYVTLEVVGASPAVVADRALPGLMEQPSLALVPVRPASQAPFHVHVHSPVKFEYKAYAL